MFHEKNTRFKSISDNSIRNDDSSFLHIICENDYFIHTYKYTCSLCTLEQFFEMFFQLQIWGLHHITTI